MSAPAGTDEVVTDLTEVLEAILDAVEDRAVARREGGEADAWTDGTLRRVHELRGAAVPAFGQAEGRLEELRRRLALDVLETAILAVAVAPDLDRRIEQLYCFANDEAGRRHATLAFVAAVTSSGLADLHDRLSAHAVLVRSGLVVVGDPGRPWAGRGLIVPERVALHLAGSDAVDDRLAPLLRPVVAAPHADVARAAAALRATGACYLRSEVAVPAWSVAGRAVNELGLRCLVVDLDRADPDDDRPELLAVAAREAMLHAAGLVIGPVHDRAGWPGAAVDDLVAGPAPVVLVGQAAWEPTGGGRPLLVLDVDPFAERAVRESLWLEEVGPLVRDPEVGAVVHRLRLTSEQVVDAAAIARARAAAEGRPVAVDDITAGVRSQNGARLEHLARRHPPGPSFADAVLPDAVHRQLVDLVDRARYRDLVVDGWGVGGPAGRSRATAALFAGPSGTGKTLSAHIVAGELGLDLYTIDLSSVVDKYIGETEKNLERLFREAEGVNGILFFDEADALLGKRSEVSDARDRYANLEVAYLLQRIERFDGLVVLATNLRSNLDEAYTRRFDAVVTFQEPDPDERRRLWELHLDGGAPLAEDLDLTWLADRFRLAGGAIRNVTLGAAYHAAAAGTPIAMVHLVRATADELGKAGRLLTEEDFGAWFAHLGGGAPRAAPHAV